MIVNLFFSGSNLPSFCSFSGDGIFFSDFFLDCNNNAPLFDLRAPNEPVALGEPLGAGKEIALFTPNGDTVFFLPNRLLLGLVLDCVYGGQHRMQTRLFAVLKCPEITLMFCATLSISITEIRSCNHPFYGWVARSPKCAVRRL